MLLVDHAVVKFYTSLAAEAVFDCLGDRSGRAAIRRVKTPWERQFARALADYFTLACAGEARHGRYRGPAYVVDWPTSSCSREEVYKGARHYDPVELLEVCHRLFMTEGWEMSYGGPSWGRIASHALAYWREEARSLTVWIDQAVNLVHNGGIALNKPTGIFEKTASGWDYITSFLDWRHAAEPEDLLRAVVFKIALDRDSLRGICGMPVPPATSWPKPMLRAVLRAATHIDRISDIAVLGLGLVRYDRVAVPMTDDVMRYQPVEWGDAGGLEIAFKDSEEEESDDKDSMAEEACGEEPCGGEYEWPPKYEWSPTYETVVAERMAE